MKILIRSVTSAALFLAAALSPLAGAFFVPVDGEFPAGGLSADQIAHITAQMQEIADTYNQRDTIKLAGNQKKFAEANNQANASTLLNGSPQCNSDISSFSFGIATSAGIVNPAGVQDTIDNLNRGKDSTTGFAANGFTLYGSVDGSVISASVLKDFIFDFKAGYFAAEGVVVEQLGFSSFMAGGGFRYRLFKPKSSSSSYAILPVTVGAGLYQVSSGINVSVDDISHSATDELTNITTEAVTDLEFSIENSTMTVPVEIICPVRFFNHLNVFAGSGFDLVFGNTKIDLKADSDVEISHQSLPIIPLKMPDLELKDSKTTKNADLFRYKLMFGGGFKAAAFTIDVPVTWYPIDNNLAVSIVAGAAF